MINTTIKITICDPTSLERSLVTSARRAGMRSLKKSKVYRGKIADMWPRATRARLRRSTVCPVKRGRGAKRKKTGKNKKCRRAPTKSRAAQCGSPKPDSLLIHSQHDVSGVPSAAAVHRRWCHCALRATARARLLKRRRQRRDFTFTALCRSRLGHRLRALRNSRAHTHTRLGRDSWARLRCRDRERPTLASTRRRDQDVLLRKSSCGRFAKRDALR